MRTSIEHHGVRIPIRVKTEHRRSIRYSITRKSVNVLIPKGLINTDLETEVQKAKDWCRTEFDKNPALLNRFRVIIYQHGEFIKVFGKDFQLQIIEGNRKSLSGKMLGGQKIEIRVPKSADPNLLNDAIGKLLSRVLSGHFHPEIVQRVNHFNKTYFQENLESIRLKNNQSNWGSCSSKRNINLSSRLLFAPLHVLDYVIVHELAHLKEMNHSPKFWAIVRKVMPEYEKEEAWLKEHGHTLMF